LLSPPLSYPLPLLSLTAHLALLSTRLPKLKSEEDEDPLFDDDWEASVFLYPRSPEATSARPPVTLLVMAVRDNIIFDPCKEELAVAEVVLAVSIGERPQELEGAGMDIDARKSRDLRLLAVRTIDPPSRLTPPGVPNSLNTATGGIAATTEQTSTQREILEEEGVWQPPRGGAKRKLIAAMIQKVLEQGGVAEEVLDGLEAVELG
jgi:exosome complex component RRP42